MCKQEIHFFNPNDVLKKRKLPYSYTVLVFHRDGTGAGIASRGTTGHSGIVADGLVKAGARQIFFSRAIWSLPGSCWTASRGQKKVERAISFSLLEYHITGAQPEHW